LPVFIGSQVVPIIALAPLLIMIFGIGLKSKVVMAALMCFFPLFMNFLSGVNSIPVTTKELVFIYDASEWFKIFKINFPLSTPYIFTGLKISSTLSVIGAIVAEFNGADFGLGKNLYLSAKRLEPELMMNSLIISILMGGVMYSVVWVLERKFGKWYLKQNSEI
jgi:NitT/TauT family transport system permease protein